MAQTVSDKLFSKIVNDTKKMKYALPNKTTEVLAKNRIDNALKEEELNLNENDKGTLLFQVLYALR